MLAAAATALALSLGSSSGGRARDPGVALAAGGGAGTIVRSEQLANPPYGARGWRLLYRSRGYDGKPAVVSGLLFVPEGSAARRDVVAFTHATVGVASRCAPSLHPAAWPKIEGLQRLLAAGYVVVAPDYQGLGSAGPHPFLVGSAEASSTLDAVRAAARFGPAHAGRRFVAWGVSQGGQAALFTGLEARSYAPELTLLGVAAGAPASELARLFRGSAGSPFARLVSAYVLQSWSQVYPRLRLAQLLAPAALPLVKGMAGICVDELNTSRVEALIGASLSAGYLRGAAPWQSQPLAGILSANTPRPLPTGIPLLLTQGEADQLVAPSVTARFARLLCAAGDAVEYRTLPGVSHEYTGQESVSFLLPWVEARFAGRPAPSNCG